MKPLNIEAAAIAYLDAALSVPVVADVPRDRPGAFVSLERTGGARDSVVIDRAMLAIQCWAPTRHEASELALEVDAALPGLVTVPRITRVTRLGLYHFPDPESGSPRYQLTASVTTAG